jgi:hypothetical protein
MNVKGLIVGALVGLLGGVGGSALVSRLLPTAACGPSATAVEQELERLRNAGVPMPPDITGDFGNVPNPLSRRKP